MQCNVKSMIPFSAMLLPRSYTFTQWYHDCNVLEVRNQQQPVASSIQQLVTGSFHFPCISLVCCFCHSRRDFPASDHLLMALSSSATLGQPHSTAGSTPSAAHSDPLWCVAAQARDDASERSPHTSSELCAWEPLIAAVMVVSCPM